MLKWICQSRAVIHFKMLLDELHELELHEKEPLCKNHLLVYKTTLTILYVCFCMQPFIIVDDK